MCRVKIDSASSLLGNHEPKPGDLSMCSSCGNPLRFGVDLVLYAVNLDTVRGAVSAADFEEFCAVRNLVLARGRAN